MLVPTRGRPQNAAELLAACDKTNTDARTTIIFGVDADDESFDDYDEVVRADTATPAMVLTVQPGDRRGMVGALNQMVAALPTSPHMVRSAVGFMGDDHRPRTQNWDRKLLAALGEGCFAVAYGDDLIQGPNLATAVVMTDDIPKTLGYMAPPVLTHLFVDNVWLDWGVATKLTYLPEVIIEHVHPVTGKIPFDEGYTAVNNGALYDADHAAYLEYCINQLVSDVEKLTSI
jgi:hypothetical protein